VRWCFCMMFLSSMLFAESDFISLEEYGKKLYKNPRGISCAVCHGEKGEGKHLTSTPKKQYTTPDIRYATPRDILKAIRKRRTIMPRYQLTIEEAKAIAVFLKTQLP